jgi:hypothetical protein
MRKWVMVLAVFVLGLAGTSSASAQTEKVQLRLRLQPGQSHVIEATVDQRITLGAGEQRQENTSTVGVTYGLDVAEVDERGAALIKTGYRRTVFKLGAPNQEGSIDYDSANPAAPANPVTTAFGALVGEYVTTRITPEGRIEYVEGVDQMVANVLDKLGVPAGATRVALAASLTAQFGDQSVRENLANVVGPYPAGPVGPGDSWVLDQETARGLAIHTTYQLAARQQGMATVQLQSTVSSSPTAAEAAARAGAPEYVLAGQQTGALDIDETTGLTQRGQIRQQLQGQVKLNDAEVPIAMDQTIRIQRLPA